jgi:hypothetical protein
LCGIPALPRLVSIDVAKMPFARGQFHRVALLILFGKSLRVIDGDRISGSERQLAAAYPPGCDALIRAGWVVTYPPPDRADLPRITASLAGKMLRERAAPVIVRRPRPQSKVMDETIRLQEQEMQRLIADIAKVQRSKTRQKEPIIVFIFSKLNSRRSELIAKMVGGRTELFQSNRPNLQTRQRQVKLTVGPRIPTKPERQQTPAHQK